MEPLLLIALGGIVVVNAAAYGACVADKRRAGTGGRRIRERTLLLLAAAGGSPGLWVGMVTSRHKTRKGGFLVRFFAICVLQTVLAILVLREQGAI